jgi:hypothetical protein
MFRALGESVIRDVHRDFRMNVSRNVQMESHKNNSAKRNNIMDVLHKNLM